MPQLNYASNEYAGIFYNPFRKEYLRIVKIVPRDTALANKCFKFYWFGILADSTMRPIAAGMLPVQGDWRRGVVTPAGYCIYNDNLSITDTSSANRYLAYQCYEPTVLTKPFEYEEIDSIVSSYTLETIDINMKSFLQKASTASRRFVHIPLDSSCEPCIEKIIDLMVETAEELRATDLAVVLSAANRDKATPFVEKLEKAVVATKFDENKYLNYSSPLINPAYYYINKNNVLVEKRYGPRDLESFIIDFRLSRSD